MSHTVRPCCLMRPQKGGLQHHKLMCILGTSHLLALHPHGMAHIPFPEAIGQALWLLPQGLKGSDVSPQQRIQSVLQHALLG